MRLSKPLFNRFMICVPKSVPFATMANRKQHDKGSGIFSLISLISLHLCYRILLSNNISLSLSDPSLCHTKSHILFESHRKFTKCQCVDESGSACNKDTTKPIATYEYSLIQSYPQTNYQLIHNVSSWVQKKTSNKFGCLPTTISLVLVALLLIIQWHFLHWGHLFPVHHGKPLIK